MIIIAKSAQSSLLVKLLRSGPTGAKPAMWRYQSTIITVSLPRSLKVTPKQALRPISPLAGTKDFSTHVQSDFQVLNHAVLSASLAHQPQPVAREMDLMEASANKHSFEKILLLINHGEAAVKKNDSLGIPVLTGRGVGQALTLSHQAALFCSNDTGLTPELVVLAPLACCIQTALHAFPYNAPDSVRGVSWICHGDLVPKDEPAPPLSMISKNFPWMDMSYLYMQHQSEDFLEWLRGRDERVIVVSSTTDWLHSFCSSSLDCDSLTFKNGGEIRAVGLY
jgi:hypothetical protein